jgi:hypothetical protein
MADFEQQTLTVEDFTGGMTDFYFNGAQNEYQKAENFLLTPDGKLKTRMGSTINNALVYQTPAGNAKVNEMFCYEDQLFLSVGRNIYLPQQTTWQTLTNPNPVFSSTTTNANTIAHAYWSGHILAVNDSFSLPSKIFKSGTSYTTRTAGLPRMAAPTVSNTAGTKNYLYAFTYFVEYTANGLTFIDESSPVYVEAFNIQAADIDPVEITNIPSLANGSVTNYDTANIKVKIYRTVDAGDTFFFVGQVNNGVTVYNDNLSDALLTENEFLYTTGGVSENDPPPPSKFVHTVNGYTFYAHYKENGVVYPNRVRQSKQDDPDSCPEGDYGQVNQAITGLSSFDSSLIVFGQTKIFRQEGVFDELGGGDLLLREFSETIGSVNHLGIVQTKEGVFFAGNDGFYWTDGYKIQRVSEKLLTTYNEAVKDKIRGKYDRANNRVLWTLKRDESASENDVIFCLDLRWGIKPNMVFTIWSGGSSFAPTAIEFCKGVLYRGTKNGYLLKHSEDVLSDPKIDITKTPNLWTKQAIIYDYASCALNFGAPQIRKWVNRILVSLKNTSNISLQAYSKNDDNNAWKPLKELKIKTQVVWGDPLPVWGDDSIIWDFYPLAEEERRMPANGLRCSYKQIRFTNADTILANSDIWGTATVNNTLKTATLNVVPNHWPAKAEDYYISFEADNYATQYLVTERTDTQVTFKDVLNTSPNGVQKWQMRGYAKGEVCYLLGYTIYYTPFTKSFKPYTGFTGGNA